MQLYSLGFAYSTLVCSSLFLCAVDADAKPWKGAEMITQQTFRYGAFEARILGARGSGTITAFFLYKDGSEVTGGSWQELDFEIFGKDGSFQTQAMTPGEDGSIRTEHVLFHQLPTLAWDRYYTYRMEWTPNHLSFFVDGQLIRRETDPIVFAKLLDPNQSEAMRLRLSIWAGDIPWSGSFDQTAVPAAMFANWAQTFSYTPGAGPNGSDFTLLWRDDFAAQNGSRWYWANWTFDVAVNDYIAQNSKTIGGYLVQTLTTETATARFPPVRYDTGTDTPPPPPTSPVTLPARVEAEAFARSFDTTRGSFGDATCGRSGTDVDLQSTSDAVGGGCNVGWTDPGEWLEYDLATVATSTFDFVVRAASAVAGNSIHIEVDGRDVGGPLSVPARGWQNFSDVTLRGLLLGAGQHTARIVFDTGQVNLNYLDIKAPSAIVTLPATIEAENFSRFQDATPANYGDLSCGATPVDVQVTSDDGGGCNVGWTEAGEWLEYDVHVDHSSLFDMNLRVSTAVANATVHVEIDGIPIGGPIAIIPKGWQDFHNAAIRAITLNAGAHVVRLVFDTGNVNVNYLSFVGPIGQAGLAYQAGLYCEEKQDRCLVELSCSPIVARHTA